MNRKITTAAIAGALCIGLAACTPAAPPAERPDPSFSTVPTTSPTPVAGVDTPLATTLDGSLDYPVQLSVYDVRAWEAEEGCDCSAPGDESTELYPAGSTAWAMRVELTTRRDLKSEGLDMNGVTFGSSWGPGAPVPVVVDEGEALAEELDLGWGYDSAQSPALFPWEQTRSFLMVVYVPRGAVALELEMEVPPIPTDYTPATVAYGLDVPIPQSVIDLMYANSNGD